MVWLLQYNTMKLIFLGMAILFLLICMQAYIITLLEYSPDETDEIKGNIVLWWTPFTGEEGTNRKCGGRECFFTNNLVYQNHPKLKALLFYGSKFNQTNLPLPRGQILWGLLHEESPRNTPILSHSPILTLFNISSTFSRYSDVPLTLQYLSSLKELTSKVYYIPVKEKDVLLSSLAPVIYLQSDCITPNNRDSYVAEMMKHIKIDSFGACLNNKKLPDSLSDSMRTMLSPELFKFIGQYKFAIAFENALCHDYITEKLWRPLLVGTVPIYIGSPTVKDWLPNNKSVILAADFDSPESLAHYINWLNKNPEEYNKFLSHKINGKIENSFLINSLNKRHWTLDSSYDSVSFVDEFECHVCQRTYSVVKSIVTKKHYDCLKPFSIVNNLVNESNWWCSDWDLAKCEAVTLRRSIDSNTFLIASELIENTLQNIQNKNCDELELQ